MEIKSNNLENNQNSMFHNLCNYLTKENNVYTKILNLEVKKTNFILDRNVNMLKEISKSQEEIIKESEQNQSEKDVFIQQFTADNQVTISSLINDSQLDTLEREELEGQLRTLKNIVFQLKNISNKNSIILKNNHDFFLYL